MRKQKKRFGTYKTFKRKFKIKKTRSFFLKYRVDHTTFKPKSRNSQSCEMVEGGYGGLILCYIM